MKDVDNNKQNNTPDNVCINTFISGLNADADESMMSNQQYRNALNLRLITQSIGESASLENIK